MMSGFATIVAAAITGAGVARRAESSVTRAAARYSIMTSVGSTCVVFTVG